MERSLPPTEAEIVAANVFRYLQQLHEIYLPQQLLEFASDNRLHNACRNAIEQAVAQQENPNVIVAGKGAALYAMMAVEAGAHSVSVVEQWQTLCSAYKDIFSANGFSDRIKVFPRQLQTFNWLEEYGRAPNILVMDTFGGALLDKGIVSAIRHAQTCILAREHILIPHSARLYAVPLQMRTGEISGFDLSEFNRYRWAPYYQSVRLGEEPFVQLCAPAPLLQLDFYNLPNIQVVEKPFAVITTGVLNAIALWYELDLAQGETVSTAPDGDNPGGGQALFYLEKELRLEKTPAGEYTTLLLKVACKNDRLEVAVNKPERVRPAANPLQASVAHWHFPMLADQGRNNAYELSIQKAVAGQPRPRVLDIGAGTGLLAMMAKRAGAERVSACEMVPHIARLAEDILKQNGYGEQIRLLPKWSERIQVPGDLDSKANILVSETVDHSLLGESFLATLNHARKHLLVENPVIIPAAATVYAAAIELRLDKVQGYNFTILNLFRAGHYTSFHLDKTDYRQLSATTKTLTFDFYQREFTPQRQMFDLPIHTQGICNAIAFWYQLHLDDEFTIDTGPGSDTTAWQQAVIFCENEFPVQPGGNLPVVASHDLHSLTFQVDDLECLFRGINIKYFDPPPWFERFSGTEKLIPGNTEKIEHMLTDLSPPQRRAALEGLIKHYVSAGFDTGLVSDFILQIN